MCVQDCRTGKLAFCPALLLGSFSCSCCAPCGSYPCWEHTALLVDKKAKIHLLIYLSSHLERATNVISYNKTSRVRIHRGDFLNLRFPLNFLSQVDWITIGCVGVSHLQVPANPINLSGFLWKYYFLISIYTVVLALLNPHWLHWKHLHGKNSSNFIW